MSWKNRSTTFQQINAYRKSSSGLPNVLSLTHSSQYLLHDWKRWTWWFLYLWLISMFEKMTRVKWYASTRLEGKSRKRARHSWEKSTPLLNRDNRLLGPGYGLRRLAPYRIGCSLDWHVASILQLFNSRLSKWTSWLVLFECIKFKQPSV